LLLPLLLVSKPLLLVEEKLTITSDGVSGQCFIAVVHRLEPTGHLLDGQGQEVQESQHRLGDLSVLLGDDKKVLLHRLLLIDVAIAVSRQLLHRAREAEGEVVDVLPQPGTRGSPTPSTTSAPSPFRRDRC
jgi:hypothetical protein